MSRTSHILICIMLTALCYMGAVRAYQFYQEKVEEQQQQLPQQSLFSRVVEAEDTQSVPTAWQPPAEDVFLEDKPLSKVKQEEQAKETIESIINDYRTNPAMRQFHEDLKRATNGKVQKLDDLSGSDLAKTIAENPEIQAVISEHMKNKDFSEAVQQIFSNPQFQQSIQVLQKGKTPAKTQTAE